MIPTFPALLPHRQICDQNGSLVFPYGHISIPALLLPVRYSTMKKKGYDTLSDEDKLMLDTYGKEIDFSDRSTIRALVDEAIAS